VLRPIRVREFVWAFAGLLAVTLTALQQQTRDLYAVPDRGDPLFSMWRMAWVRHQLIADPRHLFDANIFYPLPATLTYSDSMILPAVVSSALAALHVHPVVAYNVMLLAAFVLSGAATYVLARALGVGPLGSWIAAVAFTIAPFRVNHLSHLELQMTMWMPVALLTTYRMLSEGDGDARVAGWWRSVTLALILAGQWYSSMYYGLFLAMYVAVFAAVLIVRHKVRDRRLRHFVAAPCIAAALISPLIVVYMRSAPERGDRPRETVAAFSAVPADYVRTATRNPVYHALLPHAAHAERALFPGAATIALALAGAWPPLTAPCVAIIAAGMVAFDGSLGLNGILYRALYRWVPPLHSIRVPARFAILVVFTLALLAGIGAARLMSWLPGTNARIVTAACLTAFIVCDAWPHSDQLPVWRSPPSVYAALPPRGSVLFEFPVHSPPDRFSENLPYMYFSIWHWRPMVNGYSGFIPRSYDGLLQRVSMFPDAASLHYLGSVGVTHIALHCRLWEPDVCASTMARLDATAGLRRLARAEWYGAPSALYELIRDPGSGIRGPESGSSLNDRSLTDSEPGSRTPDPGMQR
jgi:hypothetical protein